MLDRHSRPDSPIYIRSDQNGRGRLFFFVPRIATIPKLTVGASSQVVFFSPHPQFNVPFTVFSIDTFMS